MGYDSDMIGEIKTAVLKQACVDYVNNKIFLKKRKISIPRTKKDRERVRLVENAKAFMLSSDFGLFCDKCEGAELIEALDRKVEKGKKITVTEGEGTA